MKQLMKLSWTGTARKDWETDPAIGSAGSFSVLLRAILTVMVWGVLIGCAACLHVGSRPAYADASENRNLGAPGHGLRGMLESIQNLEDFYQAGAMDHTGNANERILAGIRSLSRSAARRSAFFRGGLQAAQVGRASLTKIRENQLPYKEYDTLLHIVEAEATGGDLKSRVLVANVVLNRVADSRFPNTISEVVWEEIEGTAQFSPTVDGRIESCSISRATALAVKMALEGEDFSEGALFFLARESSDSHNVNWFDDTLVRLFAYGGHEFYTFREDKTDTE